EERGRAERVPTQRRRRRTRRAEHQLALFGLRPMLFRLVERLGQAPVHDQRLAIFAEHDVAWLQVTVQHAAAVSIGDGLTNIDHAAEQLAHLETAFARIAAGDVGLVKPLDGLLETVAAHEAHGVVRPAVSVLAESIDRYNARVFEPAGDFRFHDKARPALRVVGVLLLDLLDDALAGQPLTLGDEHFADPALGERPQDAKARAGGGWCADRAHDRAVGIALVRLGRRPRTGHAQQA